ncbi:MAG: response regulator [Nitrospiraceae bacterium]|nr:MAG: response regulator [Nitrospiraceae bacterium]
MDGQIKILCVDDEENVLRSLKRIFLDSDYEILTAGSGDEGLKILGNTEPVQIVISDYRMPGMNGVDFLREVYKLCPETVRIVLSGYADTAAIVEAVNVGHIYKFIPKPWNDDELKVAISNALDRYFIRQKNIQLTQELEAKNRELQEINSNLEKLVAERTADLMMRNRILTCSQNILDSLPLAVIGIDPEGQVVQCNKSCRDIFIPESGELMGTDRKQSLSEEINSLVDIAAQKGRVSSRISKDGAAVSVRGVHMKYSNGQEGIILVFDTEEEKVHGNRS